MLDGLPPAGTIMVAPPMGGRPADAARQSGQEGKDDKAVGPVRQSARLDDAELATVRSLQQRDRDVRAHEMAHVAVGGPLILRGAQFEYETGPDGVRYAVGGDVLIDTSPAPTPEETIDKAEHIRATALAPADPSPQDRQVAAMAIQMGLQAQVELATQGREEGRAETPQSDTSSQQTNTTANDNPFSAQQMQAAYTAISDTRFNTPGRFIDIT